MIIRWPWLAVALVLLWLPPFLSAELRRVIISTRRNAALGVAALARPWQNWFDLGRAFLGAFILTGWAILPDPHREAGSKPIFLQCSLLALGVAFQTVRVDAKAARSEHRVQLLAPVFYLCGVTLVMGGLTAGSFAVCVGWIFAIGAGLPMYQLPVMALALVAAGYVFELSVSLMLDVVLIFIPFIAAFVLRKRMVFVGSESSVAAPVLKAG